MVKVTRAKKAYGQHFLNSDPIVRRIAAFAQPTSEDLIVEIGPGTGVLTHTLVRSGARLIAVEVDPDLVALLDPAFRNDARVRIIQADILKTDLTSLIQQSGWEAKRLRVMGNLPYNIATQIIQRLLHEKRLLTDMTLMVQKEVADRLAAKPGGKEYGYLTALVQYHAAIRPGFDIAPGSFSPPPKVWSSVLQLRILDPVPWPAADYPLYLELLKVAFTHRRKTLFNNLKRSDRFGPPAAAVLQSCHVSNERRAESLPVSEWVALANAFHALGL